MYNIFLIEREANEAGRKFEASQKWNICELDDLRLVNELMFDNLQY